MAKVQSSAPASVVDGDVVQFNLYSAARAGSYRETQARVLRTLARKNEELAVCVERLKPYLAGSQAATDRLVAAQRVSLKMGDEAREIAEQLDASK